MARALLIAAAILLALPAAASATEGRCLPGRGAADCLVWTGRVTSVDDGDTIDVDVDGDGSRRARRIRITGVQAMEQTVYASRRRAGDCHAVQATLRLDGLIRAAKQRVRLSVEDPTNVSRGRLVRSVAVRIKGRWRDVGSILVREGLSLWWAARGESAPNLLYSAYTQRAAAEQRGLFDPDGCGAGPPAAVGLWANWDADGNDQLYPEGEWIKLRNLDPVTPLALGGWWVRDSGLRRFTFPASATIPPGGTVTVDVGVEGDGVSSFAWGLREPVLENVTPASGGAMGDGVYLFDPLGNVRASMIYPCRVNCADPGRPLLEVAAQPRGRESVTVRNVGPAPADLEPYRLESKPYGYAFAPGTVLQPGETLRLDIDGEPDQDTQFERHWGIGDPILDNAGDVVRVLTYTGITLACTAWGDRAC